MLKVRVGAVVAAAALALTGCGSDDDGDATSPESLAGFLGGDMDQEQLMAQAQAEQREIEEAIAECMAEEGFEYIPSDLGDLPASFELREELSEEEFRAEYGYGISTLDAELFMGPDAADDPNLAIQEEMDDAEREAYERALSGEMAEFDPDGDPDEMVFEPGGCQGEAFDEVQGERMEVFQELQPAFMELEERIQSDPRVVEAEQEWQACMQEAGYDFTERFEPQGEIFEALNELQEQAFGALDPGEIDPAQPPQPELDPDALAELQERELELAAAEGACTDEHLAEVDEEIRQEYEADFIEEHRELLEQVRVDQ